MKNKKQKIIAVFIFVLGFFSTLIDIGGTNDLTFFVMFSIPVGLYLFFTKETLIV